MAQAQMSLGLEQKYAQKLLQLAENKSKCKIWTTSKYDDHMLSIFSDWFRFSSM
jgi:F0F1-type ATP synthase delta subunit